MEGSVVPAACVAEDGPVEQQWKDCPLDLRGLDAPLLGNARAGRWELLEEYPHRGRGSGDGIRGSRGETWKGDNI